MTGPGRGPALAWRSAMAALFLVALGNTVVVTVLPAIIADLGGFDRYAWASTAYLIAATTAMPIAGRLADRHGRRAFFLIGVVIFMAASIPVALSRTMEQLVLFRALQGLGGGVIMVNSTAAIADLAPPRERGKYHGFMGMVFSLATVVGPVVGGIVVDRFQWWGWAFLINVPLGVPVLVLLARFFPRPGELTPAQPEVASGDGGSASSPAVDHAGIATLVPATVATLVALSVAGVQFPWRSWQVVGLLAFGLGMTAVFLAIESRSRCPIVPLTIYRHRGVAAAVVATFLGSFGLYGIILFVPLFFQAVQDASAGRSGVFLVPIIVGVTIGAVAVGQLVSRTEGRERLLAVASGVLLTGGIFMLSTLSAETGPALAVAYVLLMGAGVGGVYALAGVVVQNAVPHADAGAATAAVQFQRAVGGTVGVAVLGAMMARRTAERLAGVVPARVRELLPEGWLDLATATQLLVDPSASAALSEQLSASGSSGAALAQEITGYAGTALGAALGDTFLLAAAVTAASVVVAFFMPASGEPSEGGVPPSGQSAGRLMPRPPAPAA